MAHFAVVVLCLTLLLLLSPPLASATFSAVGGVLAIRKHPKILVSGHVFCDQCRQGLSSQLTVPLQDAEVGVTCVDVYGFVTYNAVAYTSPDGSFKIPLDDLPLLYGVKGCKAHLVASGDFNCNLASSVGGGAAGAKLVLNSRSLEEVIFTSGPFAYRPSRPLRLCSSSMSPSPPVTHRRLSPPPPAPSNRRSPPAPPVRKHKSPPPPPSGPEHKGKTPPSAAISYPPPPPGKPGQKKHKSPPPPATLKYRFPPGQASPPPKPVNHGPKTPPAPEKHKPKSPKPQPPPPAKTEKRKQPLPPQDHKPQPPAAVSPDQPAPSPHHGHPGHKSPPPAPPGYLHPSPPPPHHGHQGHPLPPPPSPGYVDTPPPPPHHGHQGHKDGKSPPKHKLPPLPQAPLPPPISR